MKSILAAVAFSSSPILNVTELKFLFPAIIILFCFVKTHLFILTLDVTFEKMSKSSVVF